MSALVPGRYVTVGQKNLLIQKALGSGAFGTVYLVSDSSDKKTCALKAIQYQCQASIPDAVLREAKTLCTVNHERIVQILGFDRFRVSRDMGYFLILTEFCAGGDLNSRLDKSSSVETNLKWISQISEALSYLHSRNPVIVHRDLKADNVLLTDKLTENLKLGDFGLAREYVALKSVDSSSAEAVQTYYMSSGIGPVHWMAPEFFDQRYTEKADVFSLGGIFYAIYTRDFIHIGPRKMYGVFVSRPWPHEKVGLGFAMAKLDKSAEVTFSSSFQGSKSMMRLIQDMLMYDPHARPSASKVYQRVEDIRSYLRLSADSASSPNPQQTGWCCS